jgi:hypothetical protein
MLCNFETELKKGKQRLKKNQLEVADHSGVFLSAFYKCGFYYICGQDAKLHG